MFVVQREYYIDTEKLLVYFFPPEPPTGVDGPPIALMYQVQRTAFEINGANCTFANNQFTKTGSGQQASKTLRETAV